MSKIVSIKEDEQSRIFSGVKKLVTNTSDGGTATWIPEEEAADYVDKRSLSVTANGTYKAPEGSIFDKVDVNVTEDSGEDDSEYNFIDNKDITKNGTYKASDDAGTTDKQSGYQQVTVDLPFTSKTINKNGTYNAADEVDSEGNQCVGFSYLDVQVEGEGGTKRQISKTIRKNGTYKPEDEPDDGKGEIVGYNQVDVALPLMEKKVIDHGGIFRPQSEQDENGYEYQGYKSIAVNIKITQPVMDFTFNIDHKQNALMLPFEMRIGNTAREDYSDYEIQNPPTVNFAGAKLELFSTGGNPFLQQDMNMGTGPYLKWPTEVDDKQISNWAEANDYISSKQGYWGGWLTGYTGRTYSVGKRWYTDIFSPDTMDVITKDGITKFIFRGQFKYSGDGLAITKYDHNCGWMVSNVSFSAEQYYSFTISIKTPYA